MKISLSRQFFLGLLIALIATTADLLSKKVLFDMLQNLAEEGLNPFPQIKIFDFFSIVYVLNKGISFGMFSGLNNSNLLFTIIQGSIGMLVLFYMASSKSMTMTIALSLILGGAMGNVFDRINRGGVMDFLDFHIANYHWPAFNLADSFVFLGVSIMIYLEFFTDLNKKKTQK